MTVPPGNPHVENHLSPELVRYIRSYLDAEIIQPADKGDIDVQLATVASALGDHLGDPAGGAIYDIGCGHGALLTRLATIPAFLDNPSWRYVPVDDRDKTDAVILQANRLDLLARTRTMSIADFDDLSHRDEGRRIFFCRNVLHELTIDETVHLLRNVCLGFRDGDLLLIQDLLRFPEAERNHHCWTADQLAAALRELGFRTVNVLPFRTGSGNAWFNLSAASLVSVPTVPLAQEALSQARMEQWSIWAALQGNEGVIPRREELLEALDIDLQLASLTRELRQAGNLEVKLTASAEKRVRLAGIVKPIERLASGDGLQRSVVVAPPGFRERGTQLTVGEEFLRSVARLMIVQGGSGTGKTSFIDQLLSARLYEKTLVRLDARTAPGLWAFVEEILAQLGVRLSGDVLGALDTLGYDHIAAAIGKVLNRFASRMVIVVENLDELIDTNGRFVDPDVSSLLCQLTRKDGIKVIVSSRRGYLPADLQAAAGTRLIDSVRVGRFATEQTVVNVLDDHFDRSRSGLADYPRSLLDAIDFHPLIAVFAAKILQREGADALIDEAFLTALRKKLRAELLERLLDDRSRPAVEAAAEMRIPVPAIILERLASPESVVAARSADVLYEVPDRRWDVLLSTLGLMRRRRGADLEPPTSGDLQDADHSLHGKISGLLRSLYRSDDDPKWLRESLYHRMLSGVLDTTALGDFASRYYLTELIASAHYCFDRSHNYTTALVLYEAATRLGVLDEKALMWRASCMIRTGALKEGNEEYARIIDHYTSNLGLRRSHVDALLFVDQAAFAKRKLKDYGLKPEHDSWNAQQLGRAELGLHDYGRAIGIFMDVLPRRSDDAFLVTLLARALRCFGDVGGATKVLKDAASAFPGNDAVLTLLGVLLEETNEDAKALEILEPIFEGDPANAKAVLSLVRLQLRSGEMAKAKATHRKAEKNAKPSMRKHVVMAQAELLLAHRDPSAAAEVLRRQGESDEEMAVLLVKALLAASHAAEEPMDRLSFLEKARSVHFSDALRHNVLVQLTLARLGAELRDRTRYDMALSNLAATRIDPTLLREHSILWEIAS